MDTRFQGSTLKMYCPEETPEGIGRIRLSHIIDASSETLTQATLQMVEPHSKIRTDGWDAYTYNDLANHEYIYLPCSHKSSESGDATPLAHQIASLFKRWWLGIHAGAISQEHLQYYLDEFTFQFNRRISSSRGKIFYRLIEQAVNIEPVPAKLLVVS